MDYLSNIHLVYHDEAKHALNKAETLGFGKLVKPLRSKLEMFEDTDEYHATILPLEYISSDFHELAAGPVE